jgi:hypothetical protein
MEEKSFFIFVSQEKLPELKELAEVIQKADNKIFYEAMSYLVKSYGFLGEKVDFEKRKKILDLCLQKNIKADSISNEELPAIAKTIEIKKADFGSETLTYENQQLKESIAIKDLEIIAYAPIQTENTKKVRQIEKPNMVEKAIRMGIMITTAIPIGTGKNKEVIKEVKEIDVELYLDLIFKNKTRIRINANDFDFSCLKEEKELSSMINFKRLCFRLKDYSQAYKNSAFYDLMEGKLTTTLKYDNISDLEKEELRLILAKTKNS